MKKYIIIALLICGVSFLSSGLIFAEQDKDLDRTVAAVKDGLVKSGESSEEAGNIVSRAVHQAQAEGLKGEALAERVHEVIRERKAEKAKVKEADMKVNSEKRQEKNHDMQKGMAGGMGHAGGHGRGGK